MLNPMSYCIRALVVFCLTTLLTDAGFAKTVRYELNATRGSANISGKKEVDFVLFVNNSLPAPTLVFTEGDDAEIVVKNSHPTEEISVHWHGILLPPEMDGVPYVNTPPILPGKSFTFKFKIRQSGTYWYHTHTMVQEQKGLYGGIIIHPKKKTLDYDKEAVVVVSDWSDEDADQILKNLRKDGDYYLYKKGTMRSWIGAIQAGALGTYLDNEWTRMGGMDFSDVGYDAFLINGKQESQLIDAKAGEKVRIRIINAAASSYFHIALGNAPLKVVSADGVDAKPVLANEILIGMAETYDLLFEVPENKSYELKVTAQDGTGSASAWIGSGSKVSAPVKPFPDMYASMDHAAMGHGSIDHGSMNHGAPAEDHSKMDHSNHGAASEPTKSTHAAHGAATDHATTQGSETNTHSDHSKMDHSKMDHSKMDHGEHQKEVDHSKMGHGPSGSDVKHSVKVIETLTVDNLEALEPSAFDKSIAIQDVKLVLDGDMERYVWHINGKAMSQERSIEVKEGQVIRFTFVNETMMHHPMHLHGHFFRVVNDNGESSPWKHTVDVPPHSTRIIEFLANEPGDWMLHCHNLYHMKTGMARTVKYSSFKPSRELEQLQRQDPHLHDHTYFYGMLEAATNHFQGKFRLTQTWNEVEASFESSKDESWEPEADLFFKRWIDRYTNFFAGGTLYEDKGYAVLGVSYLLPMLIESSLLVTHEGKLRLELEKRFQWHKYVYSEIEARFRTEEKTELETSLMFANTWAWSAGLKLTNKSLGFGVQYQF